MKDKLIEIFGQLNSENQSQLLDYAKMLLEIQRGEDQVAGLFKIEKVNTNENYTTSQSKKDLIN